MFKNKVVQTLMCSLIASSAFLGTLYGLSFIPEKSILNEIDEIVELEVFFANQTENPPIKVIMPRSEATEFMENLEPGDKNSTKCKFFTVKNQWVKFARVNEVNKGEK
mgnify:CR=1 FL=1